MSSAFLQTVRPYVPLAGFLSFSNSLTARNRPRDPDDDGPSELDEPWDPDFLDDDEPQPEPGDFWLEDDDD
jgi:hypothetical protein